CLGGGGLDVPACCAVGAGGGVCVVGWMCERAGTGGAALFGEQGGDDGAAGGEQGCEEDGEHRPDGGDGEWERDAEHEERVARQGVWVDGLCRDEGSPERGDACADREGAEESAGSVLFEDVAGDARAVVGRDV